MSASSDIMNISSAHPLSFEMHGENSVWGARARLLAMGGRTLIFSPKAFDGWVGGGKGDDNIARRERLMNRPVCLKRVWSLTGLFLACLLAVLGLRGWTCWYASWWAFAWTHVHTYTLVCLSINNWSLYWTCAASVATAMIGIVILRVSINIPQLSPVVVFPARKPMLRVVICDF